MSGSAKEGERARSRRRTALVVAAPIVSIATLMLGLRVGARDAVRAASVFAAPPGAPPAPGAPAPLALQILTYVEDRGVRETIAISDLVVSARSKGEEARWTGSSNEDGIAEASLAIAGLAATEPIEVEVRAQGEELPLAAGTVTWGDASSRPASGAIGAAVRPSKRAGAIGIDVLVEGERLVVGEATSLWIRVTAPDPSRVTLRAEPELGLRLEDETPRLGCGGWAELRAVAEGHVAGLALEASTASGERDASAASGERDASSERDASTASGEGGEGEAAGREGVWFGALPVAPGAFAIHAPRFVAANTETTAVLVAPNPRTIAYAEIDDERGRVFAAALPLALEPGDPLPRARLAVPPLAPGLHWLVVSGEPRGAEHLAGAAIAKPFLVGGAAGVSPERECSIGPWLAERPAPGLPRRLAVDGIATRGASNRARHRAGLAIGLVSLLAAAVLELLLLGAASREARAAALRLADVDDPATEGRSRSAGAEVSARDGSVAVALLVATLGFALLAALVLAKA